VDILNFTLDNFERFLFVFLRVMGILVIAPIFGHRSLISQVKVGLALMTAVAVFPIVPPTLAPHPHLMLLVIALVKELLMGMMIGFVALLVFIAVQFAGELIGLEIGFGIVNVIDPLSAEQVSIIGEFQSLLAMVIFLVINGHHLLLRGLAASFEMVPLGRVQMPDLLGQNLIAMTAKVFVIAVQLAAPVMATLFLTTLALGIVARTVPQMNVFVVGFPLKVIVGIAMLMFTMPMFYAALVKLFGGVDRDISTVLRLMSGR
jgi:flagellar biosynthetic protein FliR